MCARPSLHEWLRRLAAQPSVTDDDVRAVALVFSLTPASVRQLLEQQTGAWPSDADLATLPSDFREQMDAYCGDFGLPAEDVVGGDLSIESDIS